MSMTAEGKSNVRQRTGRLMRLLKSDLLSDEAYEFVKAALAILSDQMTTTIPRELRDPELAKRLIAHAHRLLACDPAKAVSVSLLAVRVAERAAVSNDNGDDMIRLQGNAWREHAQALLRRGDYARAADAVGNARMFYALVGSDAVREGALLGVISGQVRHYRGESDDGLAEIEAASKTLLYFGGRRIEYLRARITLGTVLMRREEFREALAVFGECSELADELRATELHAYIVNNVGYCAARLGDFERAEECHNMALVMFTELGATSELPRLRGAWVEILIERGRYAEAIFQLQATKMEYLELDMPVVAATFALDIVQLRLRSNKHAGVKQMCVELIDTFTAAGVPREAERALQYLFDLASKGGVRIDDVKYVRQFMDLLAGDDALVFRAPEIA